MKKVIPLIAIMAMTSPAVVNVVKTKSPQQSAVSTYQEEDVSSRARALALPFSLQIHESVTSGWNNDINNRGNRNVANLSNWARNQSELVNMFPTFSFARERSFGNVLSIPREGQTDINFRFSTSLLFSSEFRPILEVEDRSGLAWQQIGSFVRYSMNPQTMDLNVSWDLWAGSRATTSSAWVTYEVSRIYFWEN
ncbi:hypothetical protein [Spiroplasma endosymbiont of Panorpa germanica]|uniref:hypothetical protein n=1 Tax=Spiroplasma endosymbiont of Panorpa germanica TaxID=3066314 RepID=UPI0030CCB725